MREVEYDDVTALHNIVIEAAAPRGSSRSKSSVVCQRVLEYAAVAVAFAVFQWWMGRHGYWGNVKGSVQRNGTAASGVAEAPVADGLYEALTTEAPGLLEKLTANFTAAAETMINNVTAIHNLTEAGSLRPSTNLTTAKAASKFATEAITNAVTTARKELSTTTAENIINSVTAIRGRRAVASIKPTTKFATTATTTGAMTTARKKLRIPNDRPDWHIGEVVPDSLIYKEGVYVDSRTGTDLFGCRPNKYACERMRTPLAGDVMVDVASLDLYPHYPICGGREFGILACENLGVRNLQCFWFKSDAPGGDRRHLTTLWNMLRRMFVMPGDQQCSLRSSGQNVGGGELLLR
ncbi:putative transmembrane protein [Gregarina niphandrodes]|uniref:Transmembrane protein n=1 Tax=Gregarina niphandrodes TaxID=110365 RepID=A0A023AYZ0_GRENI|nr:putative transmembrane protein [Gregarina niphandrodes]EZG43678.1 putative transmembrane protein [Gregarina niphandrodes]|eukprot:XP_011133085.1 putative transmembrane protein [Gregarina niphandrodes]